MVFIVFVTYSFFLPVYYLVVSMLLRFEVAPMSDFSVCLVVSSPRNKFSLDVGPGSGESAFLRLLRRVMLIWRLLRFC